MTERFLISFRKLKSAQMSHCTSFNASTSLVKYALLFGLLPILFCYTYPNVNTRVNFSRTFFNTYNTTRIYSFVVDESNRKLYVGAKQKLFKLSFDLELEDTVVYPIMPVPTGGSACSSADCSEKCGAAAANKIKLLLIDQVEEVLVACGTANYGLCYRHSLSNISNYILLDGSPSHSNYILSCQDSSVGLVVQDHRGGSVFYFARTLDDHLSLHRQQSVSTKKWNSKMNGFELVGNFTFNNSSYHSYISIAQSYAKTYKVEYIYAFSYNDFTYFLTVQPKPSKLHRQEMRLVRVCHKDTAYYSYAELTIKCNPKLKGNKLKGIITVLDAQLATVGKDFVAAEDLQTSENRDMLFVLASSQQSNKIGLCYFDMKSIEKSFHDGIVDCNRDGTGQSRGLDFIFGSEKFCARTDNIKQISNCPNLANPNYVHYVHVKTKLSGVFTELNSVKDTKFKPKSFNVFVYGKNSTVVAVGSKTGYLTFYHIFDLALDISVANQPINRITSYSDGRFLFLQDFYSLYKITPSSSCNALKTCHMCLRHKYLSCGYCFTKLSCTSESDCKSLWSDKICPPHVTSYSPASGPLEGNTTVTFYGESLGHTTPSKTTPTQRMVTFGNHLPCRVVGAEKYDQLTCVTPSLNSTKDAIFTAVRISVYAVQPPRDIDSDIYAINGSFLIPQKFRFVKVTVGAFTPTYGPRAGGTQLLLQGYNLDSGAKASITVVNLPCVVLQRSLNQVQCRTTKLLNKSNSAVRGKVVLSIDGTDWEADGNFLYKDNPKVTNRLVKSIKR